MRQIKKAGHINRARAGNDNLPFLVLVADPVIQVTTYPSMSSLAGVDGKFITLGVSEQWVNIVPNVCKQGTDLSS